MIRRDPAYWQRLRKDVRSAVAVLFTVAAVVATAATLTMATIPGSQYDARANPFYWLIMVPVAWWVTNLAAYEPRFVRTWWHVLALVSLTSAVCLGFAIVWDRDVTLVAVSFAITQLSAAASIIAYRGSLVAREGPAR